MSITLLDGAVLIIMFISALLAMFRGFSRELLSIFSWVLAFSIAYFSCPYVIPYIAAYIHNKMLAVGVTFFIIFVVALIIISLFTIRLSEMVIDSRIGPIDRLLGFIYGILRGWLIAVLAFIFLNNLIIPEQQPAMMKDARFKPALMSTTTIIQQFLPENPENIFAWIHDQIEELSQSVPSNTALPDEEDASDISKIIEKNATLPVLQPTNNQ